MQAKCSRCSSDNYVKNGFMNQKQRYRCKECNCNFTEGDRRKEKGQPNQVKRFALVLYLEGTGFRAIERILNEIGIKVSYVSVIKWIRQFGKEVKKIKKDECKNLSVVAMELDEMWHFTKKNRINCGSGLHLIEKDTNPLLSFWGAEAKEPVKNYGRRGSVNNFV